MTTIHKNILLKILVSSALVIIIIGVGLYTNIIKLPLTRSIPSPYFNDTSGGRIATGMAENSIDGKIIKKISTTRSGAYPETQFAVEVVSNTKGELQGTVVINQVGGYKNGILYLASNDTLLQVGKTYFFLLKYDTEHKWYSMILPARVE
jgi:hypothetical protein